MNSPIAFFAYKRPYHTYRALKSLSLNKEAFSTDIYAFIDGHTKNSEIHLIDNVEKIINSFGPNFKSIRISRSHKNLSCCNNIRNGITNVLQNNESVIVLEDDICVSEFFLSYMNKALMLYKNEKEVWHINGFNFPVNIKYDFDCFFCRLMQCWGWGTWADRWSKFVDDPFANDPYFLKEKFNKAMIKEFDLDLKTKIFWSQVESNASGKLNNTWAIFWYSFIFMNRGLCLTPKISLTRNIGHDGSGIHSSFNKEFLFSDIGKNEIVSFPKFNIESRECLNQIKSYLKKRNSLYSKIIRKINFFRKL